MTAVKRECPSCRSTYEGEDKLFCPKDGTRLLDPTPAKPVEDPLIGRVIANRFVLERRLGKGGMGVVYLANHNVLKRLFAVKLLRREFVSNERALARFFREARIASSVDHPNIVAIYDYGQTDRGEPFLIMEYVEGTLLYQLVVGSPTRNLWPAQAVHILLQVARALEHAHGRSVVHRDIKPENILLTTFNGQNDWVKVLDFGVARLVGQPPLTRIGEEIIGTPEFIAPEVMQAGPDVAPPVDLYALGVMLHDTIVGEPPFKGDIKDVLHGHLKLTPALLSDRRRDVPIPKELDQLTADLLLKDPAKRPTAAEAAARLEQISASLPARPSLGIHIGGSGASVESRGGETLIINTATNAPDAAKGSAVDPRLQGAVTMVLPASVGELAPLSQKSVETPSKSAELEALEQELDGTCARLLEQTVALAEAAYGPSWPPDLVLFHKREKDRAQQEEQRRSRLALLRDQNQLLQQRLSTQKQELRQQIVALSERLQLDRTLGDSERRQLQKTIDERERHLATILQSSPTSPEPEMNMVRQKLEELRKEGRKSAIQLGHLVLKSLPADTTLPGRKGVEQLLGSAESAVAMLHLLMRSGGAKSS